MPIWLRSRSDSDAPHASDLAPDASVQWSSTSMLTKAEANEPWARKGWAYRLPTEAEWEFAARAGSSETVYPWGNRYSADSANGSGLRSKDTWRFTAPVASFQPNAYGLFDTIGNVWEWTADWYREGEGRTAPTSIAPEPASADYLKTVRGGSWDSGSINLRTSRRLGLRAGDRHNLYVGFRCAR